MAAATLSDGVDMQGRSFVQRLLWPLGGLFVALLFWSDIQQLHGLRIGESVVWGRDFVNVWTGGRLAIEGRLDALYDLASYKAFQDVSFGRITQHNFSYPPIVLFLAAPLSGLPYLAAYVLWTIAGGALFIWAAGPYLRATDGLPAWLAVLTPASLINIWAGHYGFIIGALWLYAFSRFDRAPGKAGAATALLVIKPHLALFLPFILLQRGRWTSIAVAAAGVIMLIVASGAVFGLDLWREYIFDVSALQLSLIAMPNQFFHTMMPGSAIALQHYPATKFLALWGQLATAAYASLMLFLAARTRVPVSGLCFPAATATFLALPYAFNYDMTVACLGFVILLYRRWDSLSGLERVLLILAFLSPTLTMVLMMSGLPLTPLILMGALAVQVRHLDGVALERSNHPVADHSAEASAAAGQGVADVR